MTENSIIKILDSPEQADGSRSCGEEIISFELYIASKTIPFHISVADEKATLADIVLPARKLATKLAIAFLDSLRKNGKSIPCCKGCCACCSYLIPLSIPEVFRLREELMAMPAEKSRRLLNFCLTAAEKIINNKFQTPYLSGPSTSRKPPRINQISQWYSELKLACPFLSDSLCMLYEQRPLACREHIAAGPNILCQTSHICKAKVVPVPVSVLEALGRLTAELEQSDIEAVILPLAPAWAESNIQRAERTWPAVEMVQRFAEILQEMAAKHTAPAALLT